MVPLRTFALTIVALWLGQGQAAAQQPVSLATLHEGVGQPALCDRQNFVFLRTPQGPLLRPQTVDRSRPDPIDLVLVRQRFESQQREESPVPGLKPEATSDLELHCHQRTPVIEEIFISAHSRGVALDWPATADQATMFARFGDTPVARPATLLTTLSPGSRSQLYLAGVSRALQQADLDRLEAIDRQTGNPFGAVVVMPPHLAYWPRSLIGVRSDQSRGTRIGLNVHGESVDSVVLLTGSTHTPEATAGVRLEIVGAPGSPTRATAATLSSPTLVSFSYDQQEAARIREIVGMAECELDTRAGRPVVSCAPLFRLALPWSRLTDMWVARKIVTALDETGRSAVVADSTGEPADRTCVRFVGLPAPATVVDAAAACDVVVPGRALDIAALSADSVALIVSFPGDPRRTDGVFRVMRIARSRR